MNTLLQTKFTIDLFFYYLNYIQYKYELLQIVNK